MARRLQASFDTEAGTDSHAAVRAGARPSQAVPPTLHTQMSGTARVAHLASLTLVQHADPREHSGGRSQCARQHALKIHWICRQDRGRCNLGHTQQFKCRTAARRRLFLGPPLQVLPLHSSKLHSGPCPVVTPLQQFLPWKVSEADKHTGIDLQASEHGPTGHRCFSSIVSCNRRS